MVFFRQAARSGLAERRRGWTLLVMSSGNRADREKKALRSLADLGCRGILCVSGLSSLPEDLLPENYPLVFVDRRPESVRQIPWVANDDRAAMREAADCLLDRGSRNILLMPGYLAEKRTSPRVLGYEDALKSRGLAPREDYILNRAGERSSEEETEELVRGILTKGEPIDAVITSSDRAAFGVITALRRTGLYVPEDIRLISFDNSPYTAMASPSITAIDRNPEALAGEACRVLLGLIRGEKPEKPEHIVPVSLRKRDSTR